ncbi:Midkine [Willisornis vidua]|uniref:Midkine n=1 Tax=Willisornis vidua TaxID=1566151 RepID=A0ABQ9D449_9PASS|nr:Midkine [Willisornis vidua]
MQARGLLLLLALILLAATAEAGKNKKEKVKKDGSKCEDWRWGPCVPNSKDCGLGYREGTCKDESKKLKCKIPCNWKKKFGADCKYKFESWGGCSAQTGLKTRSGILKKALYNAQCEEIVYVTKPCSSKIKSKSKGQFLLLLSPEGSSWDASKEGQGEGLEQEAMILIGLNMVLQGLDAQLQLARATVFLLLSFLLSITSSFTEMPCFNH